MSKFKSFASQGSFRDYQLQAPDETGKIREETARTIRGKERAQAFLEKNQSLYLQAQKQAQQIEAQNRETNFRLETENRQAFRDQLNQEYELQVANDRAQAAARQKDLQNLSQFSKTAFELYNAADQKITEDQTAANAVNTYRAGTTYQENLNILGLADNLNRAEFEQQDYVRQLVNEGKDIEAVWALYRTRNTRGFLNNQAVAQNTAFGYQEGARKVLFDLPADATAEQRKTALATYTNEYVGKMFTDAEGRQLNPKFLNGTIFPTIRRTETSLLGQIEQYGVKEKAAELERDTFTFLNNAFAQGGTAGLIEWYKTNPSADKRNLLAKWVSNKALDTSRTGLSANDIEELLDYPYEGPNTAQTGKLTSIREQWAGSDFATALIEAEGVAYRARHAEAAKADADLKVEVDAQLKALWNEFTVDGDGQLTQEELTAMAAVMEKAPLGYTNEVFEFAQTQTVTARTAAVLDQQFAAKAANLTLTRQDVLGVKGNYKLTKKWMEAADKIEGWKSEGTSYDVDISAIKAMISDDARVTAGKVAGTKNYSVLLMQDRYVRKYNEILAQTGGDHGQARSLTLSLIQQMQSSPGAVNGEGNYTDIIAEEAAGAAAGQQSLAQYQEFLKAATEPDFRTNPKKAVNAVGAANFYNSYEAMLKGREPNAVIKNGAALMGVSPLEFMNYLAGGAGAEPITVTSQIEQIQSQLKPITRRMYNVNRTNERVGRANMTNAGLLADAPTRFGGVGDRPLSSYAPQVSSIVMENDDGQPGMDIFFEDKKFPAVLPGVVKEVGWQGNEQAGYGNYVVVESVDPSTGEKVDVLYGHLAMPTHFSEGSSILPGMIIGTQGGTGSVRSADGTIASIDFLAPAPKGSMSMVPYRNFRQLREQIAKQLSQ